MYECDKNGECFGHNHVCPNGMIYNINQNEMIDEKIVRNCKASAEYI